MKTVAWLLFAVLCIGVGFYPILYFVLDPTFGLLSTKNPILLDNRWYQFGFYTHIISGGVALLTGWSQFSKRWRQRYLNTHRVLGKIYVVAALLASASGFAIAFFATGGWTSVWGFALLGLFYFYATARAWLAIRQRRISEHETWMVFSFAACFAAVTLRLWLPILIPIFQGEFVPAYRLVAWLCWVPNLIFAARKVSYNKW